MSEHDAQFQLLRAHVEREVRTPAVILVTSAEAGDGKSLTAYSLAQCFARAGRRSALVDAAGSARSASGATADSDRSDRSFAIVALPNPGVALSREAATEFLRSARSSYDFTIVDSGRLLSDDFALSVAGSVDGVLVSIRVGRVPTEEDDLTVRILDHSKSRVVGVVAVSPAAIASFAERRPVESALEREARRGIAPSGVAAMHPFAVSARP